MYKPSSHGHALFKYMSFYQGIVVYKNRVWFRGILEKQELVITNTMNQMVKWDLTKKQTKTMD